MPHMDLNRPRELMKKKGIDALIASTQANCCYASGYKATVSERPIMAVVPFAPMSARVMRT